MFSPRSAFIAAVLVSFFCIASTPPVLVGPNNRISFDGDFAHYETVIAIDPNNDAHQIAASITTAGSGPGQATRVYVSHDFGTTWQVFAPMEQQIHGGSDPFVVFGNDGTAYFGTLRADNTSSVLDIYRSRDGGYTWDKPVTFNDEQGGVDLPRVAVDRTRTRLGDRLFIEYADWENGPAAYLVSLSDQRFSQANVPPDSNDAAPLILHDGSLLLGGGAELSTNGGRSFFQQPHAFPTEPPVAKRLLRVNRDDVPVPDSGGAAIALDSSTTERDTIYRAWSRSIGGALRIVVSSSSDRGRTWSAPRLVDARVGRSVQQYQPAIAVNKDGVVGISWFDTRGASVGCYNEYFAASADSGRSFTPSRRVSEMTSCPDSGANLTLLTYALDTDRSAGSTLNLYNVVSARPNGGDYVAMAVDSVGNFHPVWPDAREGTWQIWSTSIHVGTQWAAPNSPVRDLTTKFDVVVDPGWYDMVHRRYVLPIHLRNRSRSPIYQPLYAVIKAGSGQGSDAVPLSVHPERVDFSGSTGDFNVLLPHAMTGAATVSFDMPRRVEPQLTFKVFGRI